MTGGNPDVLPRLRNDLKLNDGPQALDGSPTWIIVDPVRNRFFSIGWAAFELLSRWSLGSAKALLDVVEKETAALVSAADLTSLLTFLHANSLTLDPPTGDYRDYVKQFEASRQSVLMWLIHNYLFFRLPLVHPTKFLRRTLPYVEPLFSSTFMALIAFIGLLGIYIVSRQWDQFASTFPYFFNTQGIVYYGMSLIFTKVLHELAHAYTSVRYGCSVTTMGVAFLVMFPVLYTDASDTWRVRDPVQRMHIGGAGMLMELYIACAATFAWGFLPDGPLRSAAFILATTSWVVSLFINLNPLMRFDGYHIFSDFLGVQNLQKRSFAFGLWKLRELLFGLQLPPPEAVPGKLRLTLIVYAWSTWVYRLLLFFGIALLVYHKFFKVLGILLFSVEIVWFILSPMQRELGYWWKIREHVRQSRRFPLSVVVVLVVVVILSVPWNTVIKAPALLTASTLNSLYAPLPGYISEIHLREGSMVHEGQLLLSMRSPKIENDILKTRLEIDLQNTRARRVAASAEELEERKVIFRQIEELQSRLAGLEEKRAQLEIRAPFDGEIRDVEDGLHEGLWINESLLLAHLVNTGEDKVIAMVPERDLGRINLQSEVKFIPDDAKRSSVHGIVSDMDIVNTRVLTLPVFASIYGGLVPSRRDEKRRIVPDGSFYRVTISITGDEYQVTDQTTPGVAHIKGERQSYLSRFYQTATSVLVRESGF